MSRMAGAIAALMITWTVGSAMAQTPGDEPIPMPTETESGRDARMKWWREARFGMFIHWGLYAIPAGEWKGSTGHAEWIRTTAQIPIDTYDRFLHEFNPVRFNADEWVRMAKQAGMKYIVITSKHHDGFCLFDSAHTDFDVMATPFQRDILAELADACRRADLKMCWYHSIMDWHHPDYLPRRDWERAERPEAGADYDRYVTYLKNQVRELLTGYGPIGVMWFDGEWEGTWTHARGRDLYAYVRRIQPDIIINNRVDTGRAGMAGLTRDKRFAGDFGTPEQEVPATGLPGVDWESCITMNRHWGYNQHDRDFKSTEELIRMLVDVVSKGGNLLLNVGPKADGTFPQESIDRLREIGAWMDLNGESIYGIRAGPFQKLVWGRCTQKKLTDERTRLYLHVFDWPADGKLVVPGIFNEPRTATLITGGPLLPVARDEDALVVKLPTRAPDPIDTVVVLDIVGRPDIHDPPTIAASSHIFVDTLDVAVTSGRENVHLHYTTDASPPTVDSPRVTGPIQLTDTATLSARTFCDGQPVSGTVQAMFTKVTPRPASDVRGLAHGLTYEYFEGEWGQLPDFDTLTPVKSGTLPNVAFAPRNRAERFGFRYTGYIQVPRTGVYTFYTLSDDGSRLYIGDDLVVHNDGLHGLCEQQGVIALTAGLHALTVTFFEKTGGDGLEIGYAGPGIEKRRIPDEVLMCRPQATLLDPSPASAPGRS